MGIDFSSSFDFDIGFWNYSHSEVFFIFYLIIPITYVILLYYEFVHRVKDFVNLNTYDGENIV